MKTFLRDCTGALFLFANITFADTSASKMLLASRSFQDKMAMPTLYTCDGRDISPELSWADAPHHTISFAIVMSDPDAPQGTFYHWIVYNIPNTIHSMHEVGELPAGASVGKNNFNQYNYRGPCPPKGSAHTYNLTLYALDSNLNIAHNAEPQVILTELRQHMIGEASLSSIYSRWR